MFLQAVNKSRADCAVPCLRIQIDSNVCFFHECVHCICCKVCAKIDFVDFC